MDGRRLVVALLAAFLLGAGSTLIMVSPHTSQLRPVESIQLREDAVQAPAEPGRPHPRDRKKRKGMSSKPAPVAPPSGDDQGASIRVPPPERAGDDDDGDDDDGDDDGED